MSGWIFPLYNQNLRAFGDRGLCRGKAQGQKVELCVTAGPGTLEMLSTCLLIETTPLGMVVNLWEQMTFPGFLCKSQDQGSSNKFSSFES